MPEELLVSHCAPTVKDSKPIQLQLPLSGTVGAGSDAAEQTVEFQRRLRTGIVQPREKSADLCLSAQAAGKGPESPRCPVLFKTVWLSKWLCAGSGAAAAGKALRESGFSS